MKITRRSAALGGVSLLAAAAISRAALAQGAFLGVEERLEDFWLATDAYIYGYPLVIMEMTRRVLTNVAKPAGTKAPMGQFIKMCHYPDASFKDVTAPNADTLYTTSFFEVDKEPWVLNVPDVGYDRIMLQLKINKEIKKANGLAYTMKTGIYGTDYLMRGLVTAIGLGANHPQDALYPVSKKDIEGHKYSGANKYVMDFPKGQLPPVKAFWSATMYDPTMFFVNNPLNRYSISPRQNLKSNPNGSTKIYIQHESPGKDKESNWLPAPAGDFVLMLRMYWPNESDPTILDGTRTIPVAKKVS